MNAHDFATKLRGLVSREDADELIGYYYENETARFRAETELETVKRWHEETLKRANRAERALAALMNGSTRHVTRGASVQFEEFVRDHAWRALEAFSEARARMEAWPDDMHDVEAALTKLHTMALKFIARPTLHEVSKTG